MKGVSPLTACAIVGALMAASLLASQGCTAARMVRLAAGVAYKTFTVPLVGMHKATLITLKRMDITVIEDRDTGAGREIRARAGSRRVGIARPPRRSSCRPTRPSSIIHT
ncbi:MAG: hypothetical protein ACE5JN_15815 [Candidatus Methylomirabilia bacterium]